MLVPATYSRRTVCPYCDARVRLEDVRFTPTFQCPQCEGYIKVSEKTPMGCEVAFLDSGSFGPLCMLLVLDRGGCYCSVGFHAWL